MCLVGGGRGRVRGLCLCDFVLSVSWLFCGRLWLRTLCFVFVFFVFCLCVCSSCLFAVAVGISFSYFCKVCYCLRSIVGVSSLRFGRLRDAVRELGRDMAKQVSDIANLKANNQDIKWQVGLPSPLASIVLSKPCSLPALSPSLFLNVSLCGDGLRLCMIFVVSWMFVLFAALCLCTYIYVVCAYISLPRNLPVCWCICARFC